MGPQLHFWSWTTIRGDQRCDLFAQSQDGAARCLVGLGLTPWSRARRPCPDRAGPTSSMQEAPQDMEAVSISPLLTPVCQAPAPTLQAPARLPPQAGPCVLPDPAESREAPPTPQDPSPLRGTLGSSLRSPADKIMASGPITSWQIMGKQWQHCETLFFGLQNHCRW